MKNIIYVFLGVFFVGVVGLFIGRQAHLENLTEQYEKMVALGPKDISYRSKQLPLFGGGMLFYQVQFEDVPFMHTVDKMSISINGNDLQIGLKGVRFLVNDALKSKGDKLKDVLKEYEPYADVFKKPFETLALAGANELNFDVTMSFKKDGLSRQVVGEIIDKKLGRVLFDFYIPVELDRISPTELSRATLLDGTFTAQDRGLSESYRTYATSLGYKEPTNWLKNVTVK